MKVLFFLALLGAIQPSLPDPSVLADPSLSFTITRLGRADVIFVGTLGSIESRFPRKAESGADKPAACTFEVETMWKGDRADSIRVVSNYTMAPICRDGYIGTQFLLFTNAWQEADSGYTCQRVIPIESADQDLDALEALGLQGSTAIFDSLLIAGFIDLLGASTDSIRTHAIQSLAKIGKAPERCIPAFADLLASGTWRDRNAVVWSLPGSFDYTEGVGQFLLMAAQDADPDVRSFAIDGLSHLPPEAPEVLPALLRALTDTTARVRSRAALRLDDLLFDSALVVPALIPLVDDSNERVRITAVRSLHRHRSGAREALPALVEALHDSSPGVRGEAVRAIVEIAPLGAEGRIAPLLSDPSDEVRGQVLVSLADITVFDPARDTPLRPTTLDHMREVTLTDTSDAVRSSGLSAFATTSLRYEPIALGCYSGALRDPSLEIRQKALRFFRDYGATITLWYEEAVPLILDGLVTATGDENETVRAGAVRALAKLDRPELTLPHLAHALSDTSARMRWIALDAVRQMGSDASPLAPRIEALLNDDDEVVRRAAGKALDGLTKKEGR